jgi:hypothetical protein
VAELTKANKISAGNVSMDMSQDLTDRPSIAIA